ncbi:MAG: hypothetical protein ACREFQ_22915 [Stellaceae bacterium]
MHLNQVIGERLEFDMTRDERYLIKGCLNECCHGFRLSDFRDKIGAEKPVVSTLLDQLSDAEELSAPSPEELGIIRGEGDRLRVALTRDQARVFVNCMNETEKALDAWEFPSRLGAPLSEVKALFSTIEAALGNT